MRPILALPLLLAACATGAPVDRQVVVDGGRFQAVQGEAALVVRTFLPPQGNTREEVLGAQCDVASSLYTTRVVTPSRLVLPNFGPQSPELLVTCRAGERTGSANVRIITRWQSAPGYWGYPGYGSPWGWGGWGWGAPGYPVSDYPNVNVILQ